MGTSRMNTNNINNINNSLILRPPTIITPVSSTTISSTTSTARSTLVVLSSQNLKISNIHRHHMSSSITEGEAEDIRTSRSSNLRGRERETELLLQSAGCGSWRE